jgi:enoyl-CoA hydratase/carnithine racemase
MWCDGGELSMNDVVTSIDGYVGILTICRPPTNFFDPGLLAALPDAATNLHSSDGCRALVLRSEGKHFCAGADFSAEDAADRTIRSINLYRSAVRLFRLPIPLIAAVQGAAVGGGLGLACAADFRVASDSSRFHANFVQLGFHPGFGLSESLPAIVGQQAALDLLYSGCRIGGIEAHVMGLVDRLTTSKTITSTAIAWAHELASAAPLAVEAVKATLRGPLADKLQRSVEHELTEQTLLWQTEDCQRGIAASLNRQSATFIRQ